LVSDAISHVTLPGTAMAFLVLVALGGDGRWLPGLLIGATVTAVLGLGVISWLTTRTRLTEDAAIGAVLSVFFGAGIVLLTVIQSLGQGRAAGLEDFLLGSTAGMLASEAATIAVAGAITAAVLFALRRPMTLVVFDPGFAASRGTNVALVDLAIMMLAVAVTVIGLKIVGLILIVALLIIPPVIARFWTNRVDRMLWIAATAGGLSAWIGVAISASAAALPTGPIIVLVAFGLFVLSLLVSPNRGLVASLIGFLRFQSRVHLRQGLLNIAREEPVRDAGAIRVLKRRGYLRADGVPTRSGRFAAAEAERDETRWAALRRLRGDDPVIALHDGVSPIRDALTPDEIAEVDRALAEGRA
ncbi:MAG: metal ABC transporter permease, partial [Rubricella sp.]